MSGPIPVDAWTVFAWDFETTNLDDGHSGDGFLSDPDYDPPTLGYNGSTEGALQPTPWGNKILFDDAGITGMANWSYGWNLIHSEGRDIWTVEALINPKATGESAPQYLLNVGGSDPQYPGEEDSSLNRLLAVGFNSSTNKLLLKFDSYESVEQVVTLDVPEGVDLDVDAWFYLAWVRNNDSFKVYVNAVQGEETTLGNGSYGGYHYFTVGALYRPDVNLFKGHMAGLRFSNKARTLTEIQSTWAAIQDSESNPGPEPDEDHPTVIVPGTGETLDATDPITVKLLYPGAVDGVENRLAQVFVTAMYPEHRSELLYYGWDIPGITSQYVVLHPDTGEVWDPAEPWEALYGKRVNIILTANDGWRFEEMYVEAFSFGYQPIDGNLFDYENSMLIVENPTGDGGEGGGGGGGGGWPQEEDHPIIVRDGDTVSRNGAIEFSQSNNVWAVVSVAFPSLGNQEVAWDGEAFTVQYAASERTASGDGWAFALRRQGGWPSDPKLIVYP